MAIAQEANLEVLRNENALLQVRLAERDEKISEQDQKIIHLEEQLNWFKKQLFGKKSERDVSQVNSEQLQFEGFAQLATNEQEQTKTIPAHTRRKPNRDGSTAITLPKDLPVETTFIDLPEDQKICPETKIPLVKIGEEVSYKMVHKPGSFVLKEIVRPKYAHPGQPEKGILMADLPESLLPRCQADDTFLAYLLVEKFVNHMPLYRIQEELGRQGIGISRNLLSKWVIRCGMALKPLYREMKKHILESQNIFIDEAPVKLQDTGKCQTAYMWVVVGGTGSDPPYRVYEFKEDRCHHHVLEMLKEYRGALHSDKFAAYEKLAEKKQITWHPCYAHIRRKFFEAEAGDRGFRVWVLRKMKYLFLLERVAWARAPEERLRIRQEKEVPLIDELIAKVKEKLQDRNILPKSKLREAIGYFCGLIPYLKNYTNSPWARLDNNVVERAIRPLAIGRKNWLFFGSKEGGEAGAVIFSLVQTCRGLGINPYEYLVDIFPRFNSHSANKLYELLPDQWREAKRAQATLKKATTTIS